MLYCGHQCIALRGHLEQLESSINLGNFLAMLRVLANHDPTLKSHLENPRLKNATYISPDIQNQIADVIGKSIILLKKLCMLNNHEVTSHNQELMPLDL